MSLVSQTTSRASHWGITINNPTEEDRTLIRTQPKWLRMVKGQDEIGENGTLHIQAYANTDQVRLSSLKQWLPRAHFSALTTKQHIENMKEYVHKKDGTEVEGTQFELVIREANNFQSLSMANVLTQMAMHAYDKQVIQDLCIDGKDIAKVYEQEYWDIVNTLLIDDENLISIFTMPQYKLAWIKTRRTWVVKAEVDRQTKIDVEKKSPALV